MTELEKAQAERIETLILVKELQEATIQDLKNKVQGEVELNRRWRNEVYCLKHCFDYLDNGKDLPTVMELTKQVRKEIFGSTK